VKKFMAGRHARHNGEELLKSTDDYESNSTSIPSQGNPSRLLIEAAKHVAQSNLYVQQACPEILSVRDRQRLQAFASAPKGIVDPLTRIGRALGGEEPQQSGGRP